MKKHAPMEQAKVGLFLVIGIGILVTVIIMLGRSESLFTRRAYLHASFKNISGLIVGAPVRLAGVDVGVVNSIRFERDLHNKEVHVVLAVQKKYLDRVRADSTAQLVSNGLLGDKLIDLTVGSEGAAPLQSGDHIRTEEGADLAQVAAQVQEGINAVRTLATDVDTRLRLILTEDLARDTGRAARSLADIIDKVEHGHGLVHNLIYDPDLSRSVADLVDGSRRDAADLDHLIQRGAQILAAVQTGDGAVHGLIYGQQGSELVRNLARLSAQANGLADQIEHGNGMIHSLLYEQDRGNLVANLTEVSRILKQLAVETEEGKGTIGALLKDPTIYEDLKQTLERVERNVFLKAVIRYTIRKDRLNAPQIAP